MLLKWLLLWLWRGAQIVTFIPGVCQSRFRWFRTALYCLFGNSDTGTIFESSRFQTSRVFDILLVLCTVFCTCFSTNLLGLQCVWRWRAEANFCCHVVRLYFCRRCVSCVRVTWLCFSTSYLICVWFGEDLQRANTIKTHVWKRLDYVFTFYQVLHTQQWTIGRTLCIPTTMTNQVLIFNPNFGDASFKIC